MQIIKDKQGKSLIDKDEILERWAEYVEELYDDKSRGEADMGDLINEVYCISSQEISELVNYRKEKHVVKIISRQSYCSVWERRA